MGRPIRDLTGYIFNRLTVIRKSGSDSKSRVIWECLCECGNTSRVASTNLVSGTTQSCGCLIKEIRGESSVTHGQNRKNKTTSEYRSWQSMKARCLNQKNKEFKNYGGRGIKVCEKWLNSFENFYSDMGDKPTPLHSIDRFPDTNGNYERKNCRWATQKEQQHNRRNNKWVEFGGKRLIKADWAREFKISHSNLCNQLKVKSFKDVFYFYKKKR